MTSAAHPTGLFAPWPAGRREWALLGGVLLLAGLLRLIWPGLTEFKQDEAHLYALALDLVELKALPLVGISSSVGLPNAPLSVYLFALPLVVWRSPLAATLFVGLLNTASVALAYGVARRYWGPPAALAAALLYAAAPWAVIYSRKIWAQDLLPLFVLGYIAAGLLAFVEGRRRWVMAHVVLLLMVVQIHLSGLALVPLTLTLLVIFRRRVAWRYLAYGALAAVLTLLPVGVYLLGRARELAGITVAATRVWAIPATVSLDAVTLAGMVVAGTQVRGLAGPQAFRAFEATLPNLTMCLWLGGALCLAGLIAAVWPLLRRSAAGENRSPAAEAGLVVALWLTLPVLFFLRHSTPVYAHYFILLLPAPYLLAGVAVAAAAAGWRGVWLAPLAVTAAQAWLVLALLHFVGTQATPGAFGRPLQVLLQAAHAAQAPNRPEIVVVADGSHPEADLVPAVFDVLLRDVPHRFVDGRTTAVLPAGAAVVLVWPADYGWPVEALYQQWGGGQWAAAVAQRAGEGDIVIAASAGVTVPVPQPRPASALLANGVEVVGHAAAPDGWQLWWRAPGPQAEAVHLFAHLYAGEQRVAQVDAATSASPDWRPGDLVVSYFALPRTGAIVRAGFYAYPSLAPVPVLDAEGQPAGEWLEFRAIDLRRANKGRVGMSKTIVITGGSSGLGRATALHCAALGWRVWATVRKEADLSSLLVEAMSKGWGERLTPVLCDITQPEQVARLARVVAEATPTLDALVNNAGTGYPGPLEFLPIADVRAELELNTLAHLAVTQALLPLLKPARGTLINVSSIGGRIVYPINGAYHMSKFALEAMSDALRVELAPSGVRVVIVEPGSSPTAIWTTSLERGLASEVRQRAAEYAPLMAAVQRAAMASARQGFPPEQFARLIERIVTSRRPAPRYVIPWFVGVLIFIREHLPDRLWDWGVRRVLGW